jgi:hypothetical protein
MKVRAIAFAPDDEVDDDFDEDEDFDDRDEDDDEEDDEDEDGDVETWQVGGAGWPATVTRTQNRFNLTFASRPA